MLKLLYIHIDQVTKHRTHTYTHVTYLHNILNTRIVDLYTKWFQWCFNEIYHIYVSNVWKRNVQNCELSVCTCMLLQIFFSFLFFSYTVSLCDTVCMVEDIIIIFSSKHKYYFLKLWLFWERMKFAVILELRNAKITAEYKRNCLHSPTYINYFNWNLVFRTS